MTKPKFYKRSAAEMTPREKRRVWAAHDTKRAAVLLRLCAPSSQEATRIEQALEAKVLDLPNRAGDASLGVRPLAWTLGDN